MSIKDKVIHAIPSDGWQTRKFPLPQLLEKFISKEKCAD